MANQYEKWVLVLLACILSPTTLVNTNQTNVTFQFVVLVPPRPFNVVLQDFLQKQTFQVNPPTLKGRAAAKEPQNITGVWLVLTGLGRLESTTLCSI